MVLSLTALLFTLQFPTANVSYRAPAQRIPVLLRELAAQTRVPLRADEVAAKEVVIVSVKDVPLSTLMEKIALVTSCKWRHDPDNYTLVPDQKARDKEESQELAERTKQVKEAIDRTMKDPGSTDFYAGSGRLSDSRLAPLLKLLDPAQLAALEPGERYVWALSEPLAMQRSLSPGSAQAFAEWRSNEDDGGMIPRWLSEKEEDLKDNPNKDRILAELKAQERAKPFAKAILSAQLDQQGFRYPRSITMGADLYDGSGSTMMDANLSIPMSEMPSDEQQSSGKPIVPSAQTQEFLHFADESIKVGPFNAKMSPRLAGLLLHPEATDPLALEASDALLQYADLKNRPLVADVPDSAMQRHTELFAWESLDDVQRDIEARRTLSEIDDASFMLLKSAHPRMDRLTRLDRLALRALFADAEANRLPTLDAMAVNALSNPPLMTNRIETVYGTFGLPGLTNGNNVFDFADWDTLRFYGLLNSDQRSQLLAGKPIRFSSLSRDQVACVQRMVFGADEDIDDVRQVPEPSGFMLNFDNPTEYGEVRDFRWNEPTELLPRGITPDGSIECSMSTDRALFGAPEHGPILGVPLDAWAVASVASDVGNGSSDQPPTAGVMGTVTTLNLKFVLSAPYIQWQVLYNCSVPKDSHRMAYKSLPGDFLDEIDDHIAQMKANQSADTENAGAGSTPPR